MIGLKLRVAATLVLPALALAADPPVQSQHVRDMIVSCKPDGTMRFYRDVLGMCGFGLFTAIF